MPELPEVETVRRGLLPVMEGRVILSAQVNRPDLRWPLPPRMAERLAGQRVLALRRRSKYILADLASGETLIIHLGMSGRMLVSGAMLGQFHHDHPAPQKHDHVVLEMEGGARITFNDARRFGSMDLIETACAETHPLLAALGPEPLVTALTPTIWQRPSLGGARRSRQRFWISTSSRAWETSMSAKRCSAPAFRPSGLQVTWRPYRRRSLSPSSVTSCPRPSTPAAARCATIRQADGELGYFQHTFRVYDREGEACLTPGCSGIISRVVQSGRSSFFCPLCQH